MIAQIQAINKLLDTNDYGIFLSNNIDESFFSNYLNEYRFIKEHIDKYGKVPDKLTFFDKFPSFDSIVVDESNQFIIDSLYEDKNKRQLANIFNKIKQCLNDGNTDEALQIYLNSQSEVTSSKKLNVTDIFQDTSRYDTYLDMCDDFKKYYINTGFKELDKIIGGWNTQEELATIVARGGVGKTWFLLKSATAAAEQGLTVGIFSGEMGVTNVAYRIDTLIAHISNTSLSKGNRDVQNDYKRYLDGIKTKYKKPLYILTPDDGPIGVSGLRAFIEEYKLDILFVDQHSLLVDEHHASNPISAAANISKDLKNLQVLKKIPIIAACQQNRVDTEETGVSLKNISQSDRIGQDATVVLFFEQKNNILTMTLAKSRSSASQKSVKYAIDLDKGIFEYIPEENNGVDGAGTDDLDKEFGDEGEADFF